MPPHQDPIGHLLACKHRRLDSMLAEVQGVLADGEEVEVARKAFARLRAAVESHMAEEDAFYEPAIERLTGATRTAFVRLLEAHSGFRGWLVEVESELATATRAQAGHLVGALGDSFQAHEDEEERLLANLDPAAGIG
jgi:hypothetical protein